MFTKPFFSISAQDIQDIVANSVSEDRQLDFKEKFQIQSDSEKKEFLADISSFANMIGGLIIFGVEEERDPTTNKPTGIAKAILGLENFNADAEILRLESMIRDGLAPRLSGVLLRKIDGFPSGPILLIRIPQSWASPHMVTYQTKSPFFERGNAGKYPMDVSQIRSSFLFLESLSEKIKDFHQDRVAKVIGGAASFEVRGNKKLIIHIVPLSSYRGDARIDLATIKEHEQSLAPLTSAGFGSKINLEGMATYLQPLNTQVFLSYAQVFRNGAIELVDTGVFSNLSPDKIPTIAFERQTIEGVRRFLKFLVSAGIQSSAVILASIVGVKGMELGFGSSVFVFPGSTPKTFDRDLLTLPEVIVESLTAEVDVLLRPIFDALHNAAGWDGSMNYNPQGRWEPGHRQC